jgi:hypothetical protein
MGGNTAVYECPEDPCDEVRALNSKAFFNTFMTNLRTNTSANFEAAYSFKIDGSFNYAQGANGQHFVSMGVSNPIDGYIHNHFSGGIPNFSDGDIELLKVLYDNNKIKCRCIYFRRYFHVKFKKKIKMKKGAILFMMIIITSLGFSQSRENRNESGRHLKPAGLNKFYGTWKYEGQGDVFTIVLTKDEYYNKNSGDKLDFAVGYHSYKRDGVMIDGYDVGGNNTITTGSFDKKVNNENILSFRFRETKNRVNARGTLTYVKGKPDKLVLKLILAEGGGMINIDGKGTQYKLHVPNNIELKRVK